MAVYDHDMDQIWLLVIMLACVGRVYEAPCAGLNNLYVEGFIRRYARIRV